MSLDTQGRDSKTKRDTSAHSTFFRSQCALKYCSKSWSVLFPSVPAPRGSEMFFKFGVVLLVQLPGRFEEQHREFEFVRLDRIALNRCAPKDAAQRTDSNVQAPARSERACNSSRSALVLVRPTRERERAARALRFPRERRRRKTNRVSTSRRGRALRSGRGIDEVSLVSRSMSCAIKATSPERERTVSRRARRQAIASLGDQLRADALSHTF